MIDDNPVGFGIVHISFTYYEKKVRSLLSYWSISSGVLRSARSVMAVSAVTIFLPGSVGQRRQCD